MRLYELKKPKEITQVRDFIKSKEQANWKIGSWEWTPYVKELLAAHDFEPVGSGSRASVYMHPTYNFALKVFEPDSGYVKWFEFSKRNQDNPFCPKLRGKIVTIVKGEVFAARIEKLQDIPTIYEELNEQSQLLLEYWNDWPDDFHNIQTGNKYLDPIFKLFGTYYRYLDFGSNNIMRRGNQAVIIDPFFGGRKKLKKR